MDHGWIVPGEIVQKHCGTVTRRLQLSVISGPSSKTPHLKSYQSLQRRGEMEAVYRTQAWFSYQNL